MIKLKKIFYDPSSLLTVWVFFLTSPFVDTLNLFIFQRLSESNQKLEFIFSILHKAYLPALSIFIILFFILWYKNILRSNLMTKGHHAALLIIGISSIIYGICIQLLSNLEQIKYSNYLYSHFGLKPTTLEYISIVNLMIVAIIFSFYVPLISHNIGTKKTTKKYNFNLHIYIVSIALAVSVALSLYPFLNVFQIFNEKGQGYSQRLGPSYLYVDALVKSSPTNSEIIHPPQSQNWPLVGNQPIIRYFLFPRTLISGALIINQSEAEKFNGAYFVKISSEDNVPEWPTINVENRTIIFNQLNKIRFTSLKLVNIYNRKEVYQIIFK